MYQVPDKIKHNIFISNLATAIVSGLVTLGVLYVQFFVLQRVEVDASLSTIFSWLLWGIAIISFLFLFCPALIALIFKNQYRHIEKQMEKYQISTDAMASDYDNAEKMASVKIGAICTYFKQNGKLCIIPNANIVMVYKKINGHKQKRVARSYDGTVLHEKYVMGENYTYYVVLKQFKGRSYKVRCRGPLMADKIVHYYAENGDVILGNSPDCWRAYKKRCKELREQEAAANAK